MLPTGGLAAREGDTILVRCANGAGLGAARAQGLLPFLTVASQGAKRDSPGLGDLGSKNLKGKDSRTEAGRN